MIKLDIYDLKMLRDIERLTNTDFKIDDENRIETEKLLSVIEELYYSFKHLFEEIEDIKQDRDENYKPIPYKDQVGISDKDFY